jgi:hypothetical protein
MYLPADNTCEPQQTTETAEKVGEQLSTPVTWRRADFIFSVLREALGHLLYIQANLF